jgi:hypothetical protein
MLNIASHRSRILLRWAGIDIYSILDQEGSEFCYLTASKARPLFLRHIRFSEYCQRASSSVQLGILGRRIQGLLQFDSNVKYTVIFVIFIQLCNVRLYPVNIDLSHHNKSNLAPGWSMKKSLGGLYT